jgi:hypothetical protein
MRAHIDPQLFVIFTPNMADQCDEEILKFQGRKFTKAKTVWMEDQDAEIYDLLSHKYRVCVAEYMRRVMKRELRRLLEIERSREADVG